MTSVKETLAVFEEIDKKLDDIAVGEAKLKTDQRIVSNMRDEAERKLLKAQSDQEKADATMDRFRAESVRKEDDLKNREVTLAAKSADLDRKIAEQKASAEKRENEITRRLVELEKREQSVKEAADKQADLASQYASLATHIKQVVG